MATPVKSEERPANKENQGIAEKFDDALHGRDEPMEVAYPGATPALVMGSYPIILILGIVLVLAYFTLFRQNPRDSNTIPPAPAESLQKDGK